MKLMLSPSPHLHGGANTRRIMLDVLIALSPACVASVVLFSARALLVLLVSVLFSVATEHIFCLVTSRKTTVTDLSAAVTGVILALILPHTVPLWQVALGAVVAIAFVKMLFGGIGANFANPACTARVVLLVSFTSSVAASTATRFMTALDGVSGATPLPSLNAGNVEALPSLLDCFLGNHGGAMGETSAVMLLVGFLYLVFRRVVTIDTPVAFIGSTFLSTLILTGDVTVSLYAILTGGLLFGAFFMATDYTTTPITTVGRILFGVGAGVITTVIRLYAALPEGVSYAILIMNILTPLIDRLVRPRAFGGAYEK